MSVSTASASVPSLVPGAHAAISPAALTARRKAFRALHERGCFVMPNPWDADSARYLTARAECYHVGHPDPFREPGPQTESSVERGFRLAGPVDEEWGRSESLDPDNVGDIADEGTGHRG